MCYRKLEIRAHIPLKLEEVLKVLEMAECRNLGSLKRQGLSGVCAFKESYGKQRQMPAGAPGGGSSTPGGGELKATQRQEDRREATAALLKHNAIITNFAPFHFMTQK